MKINKYKRKAFAVEGVQVTANSFDDAAAWCEGKVTSDDDGRLYVLVPVHKPQHEGQKKAYVGMWILKSPMGFKVYTERAFNNSFDEAEVGVEAGEPFGNVFDNSTEPDTITHRDAETGKYVTEEYADDNPSTTVRETRKDEQAVLDEIFKDN